MNIYDIAKMAGVSIATVSRVVNGSDKVSEKTKRRVMEVIEKEGYTPNVFAQGLGLNTMHTAGILVPDISDLYMSSAISFLEEGLRNHGYNCILGCSGFRQESMAQHVQMLLSKKIDGLILVGSAYAGNGASERETDYIREAAAQVPVFVINGAVKGENVFSAVCGDRDAMHEVTSALLRRGRKRILFLTDSDSYSAREKMAGYEEALTEAGLPVLGDLKLKLRNRIHATRDLLLQSRNLDFDAVVATDDGMAVGAVKYAAARGLRIPEALNIVGYKRRQPDGRDLQGDRGSFHAHTAGRGRSGKTFLRILQDRKAEHDRFLRNVTAAGIKLFFQTKGISLFRRDAGEGSI